MPRLSKIGAAALAAFGWTGLSSVTASYLQVAGGGGGGFIAGGNRGAGGGAGGFLTGTVSLNPTQSYTVTVGAGGTPLANGSNSQFGTLTASVGGGAGGSQNGASSVVGQNGGSGGGGPSQSGSGSTAGGTGTAGQGNNGAAGSNVSGQPYGCGGGGGAGAVGTLSNNPAGAGGVGLANPITGSTTGQLSGGIYYLAGGGGGGTYAAGGGVGGAGGLGGGGLGGGTTSANGVSGTANTGGGGGGAEYSSSAGASGGSGVVIISYVGAQQFGGGVVTSSGGNTIHTFTTSGTLSPLSSLTASALIVAGGGGGSYDRGGGGGAGGLQAPTGLTIDTNSIYVVTVGSGGAGATTNANGTNGTNSTFSIFSTASVGGGGGASYVTAGGSAGGSGGGGSYTNTGGAGTSGQGNAGGNGESSVYINGGGGGGASAAGQTPANSSNGGNGGNGSASSISGTSVTYAGGGGGGHDTRAGGSAGTGGTGGGGAGGMTGAGTAGTTNLGGGGGGGGNNGGSSPQNGGNGGSGIVIISYPGSTQQMAGGTVTVAGGNVIHTFTSSGYLTPIVLVNNSLRFRSSVSAYLNRTPASAATSRRIMTYSAWVKLGILGTQRLLYEGYTSVSDYEGLIFNTSNQLEWSGQVNGGTSYGVRTPAVFRDPSAWYHVVIAIDTTQATDTNRIKIYVNGVQQTGLTTFYSGFPAQNTDLEWNNQSSTQVIGWGGHTGYYDGYMADINMVDGQALTPNSFGSSNGLGVWQPIRYGGSYGTNGFYLPFNSGTSSFAGSFNGSSQYLTVAQNAAFNMGSGDFTIESWVYFNTSGRAAILSQTNSAGQTSSTSFYLERNASNFLRIIVGSGGTGYEVIGATVVPSGQWIHVAGVRNGNNLSCYLNGVSQGTVDVTGVSINSATDNVQINGYGTSTALVFAGGMSNVRIVKGTAVYTSNFTPPTSNLTAISGTSLLTLQNATIVDNSGNSFTITNNNSVTTGQTYPFAYNTFNDQSPQGNNWTPNNFSGASGSTLDYMTDVPTLTSATAGNYCVLNPLDIPTSGSPATLSEGNLKCVTPSSGYGFTVGTIAVSSGKWYWEYVATAGSPNLSLGFGLTTCARTYGGDTGSYIYYAGDGKTYANAGAGVTYGATWTTGDVIAVALDLDAGTAVFYKNNVSQGTAFTGLTGTFLPIFSDQSPSVSNTFTVNFGQQPFTYTPPTGFVRLNTFNLPTPTIGATASTTANKYMDVLTWTGNGASSRAITGLNFQPDWVWDKMRSDGYQHAIVDSVRGGNQVLHSNSASAEDTNWTYGYVSSFDSNGFTIQAGSTSSENWNLNAATFVAWNWNAGGSTVTNTTGSINSQVRASTTAGFSIVTYTGNGTSGATVGHGLGVAPSMVILKRRDSSSNWQVKHSSLNANQNLNLNLTAAVDTAPGSGYISAISSTTLTLLNGGSAITNVNGSGGTYVAYCFAPVAGYSAFGSYTGNGSTDGPFVYLGFRPRYIMIKSTVETSNWFVYDTARDTYNTMDSLLFPSDSGAEYTDAGYALDALSNGFKIRATGTYGGYNNNGNAYIYACFAENPFKYANAR